ncbi:META domain-containing protein [Brumimicrobium mesophilum]|uniref:META domain-containing protein n=1 Tax=Brumimicrobium mesophilum TaxID=392717 RepID=UPI000D1402A6|nr:META domain-containing protein [Brumimicrobium mesophilum]
MKFKSVLPFVAGLIILQSCSTPKNEIMWVGGIKTQCDAGSGMRKCLNVFEGEDLKDENWKNMYAGIQGFEFEEGVMKKIEVKKEERKAKNTPADASTIKYTLINEIERKEDPRAQLKGNWVLTSINEGVINKMVVLPTLMFDLEGMKISGNGGCNLYSAQIGELTTQKIEIKQGLGTLKACNNKNIESEYHKALSKVEKYEISDNKLEFYDQDGNTVLTYLKVEVSKASSDLSGVWNIMKINDNALLEVKSKPSITFDLDKMTVSGKDGCNNFNAQIETLSNADLEIGQVASTKMMCPDMETSNQFLLALDQVVSYKIQSNQLVMLDKDGKKLVLFER